VLATPKKCLENLVLKARAASLNALFTTVSIRIVADFGSRIFQFTTNAVADYNVHIYYYFGYYFYTLLPAGSF